MVLKYSRGCPQFPDIGNSQEFSIQGGPVYFKAWWRIISNKTLDSRVGMSPIGSYVRAITSKWQVGVLLWEHRGWMLHMAFSYKAKNIGYNSMLSSVPTYSILLSTIFDGPPLSPERETCCKLSFCRTIAFLTYNAETGIPSCNLPFSSTASLWTSIDKPIKLLLSWKKGGPSKMGDSWFLYVNRKEWRVYDMSFFLVTRLLNARTCLFRTDSKQSLRPFVFIWKGNGTVPRLKSDCLPV